MNYINTSNWAYPLTEAQVRAAFPNVSFPVPFIEIPEGFAQVAPVAPPAHNPLTQHAVELSPRHLGGASWEQRWEVQALAGEIAAARLAEAQADTWARIKAHRDLLSDNGGYKVVVSGVDKWFHSDGKSKTQQLALVIMGVAVPPVQWKTMDGSFVPMTQALAGAIFQAAATMDMALFAAAEAHRAAMMASARPDLYDFSGGWPATYGG